MEIGKLYQSHNRYIELRFFFLISSLRIHSSQIEIHAQKISSSNMRAILRVVTSKPLTIYVHCFFASFLYSRTQKKISSAIEFKISNYFPIFQSYLQN